jgi:dihydrodipicolinate synthase/N-acetylneuraminate lyase
MQTMPATKKISASFHGMMPILPTAITASGGLDEASQRRVVQYCLQCGAVAIGHFGIASEYHKIAKSDRPRLTRIIIDEVAGQVPVFIGVTSPSTEISIEYARQAEEMGASLIMASLPDRQLPDADGAFEFYQSLAKSTSLPIIIQDTPTTSSLLTSELILKMFREIEGIRYVKAEGKTFIQKTATLLAADEGISVIGGAGGKHLLHLLRLGVTSFMTGTEALDLHAAAVSSYLRGETDRAARIYYEQILPYLTFYLDYSEELLKWMLCERGVIGCARALDPPAAAPMEAVEREELQWVLERIGWRKMADRR